MTNLRIGSLFTGTGQLDRATQAVFGGHIVWHSQYEPPDKDGKEDTNQYAAKILAQHWPDVPNLGDITKVDWQQVLDDHGPIDILTGGFPCQDVSSAGKRAGLTADSRSGLWTHMARAIHELNPELVVIENVQGLLSAPAASDMEPCPHCVGDGSAEPSLRALGAVLGDLASLGFDAEWAVVAASEVGAPHHRKRVIIYARRAPADTADLGHQRGGDAWERGNGPADSGLAAAHASSQGLEVRRVESDGHQRQAPERGCGEPAADADGRRCEGHQERDRRTVAGQPERERGLDAVGRGVRRATVEPDCPTCADETAADPRHRDDPERARPSRREEGQRSPVRGLLGNPGEGTAADADLRGQRAEGLNLRPGQPDIDWGPYEPAIHRWERALGRPAPWPTDALGRLSPVFTEWLMGMPDGWVTCTSGLTRSAMLRALGNGVVPQQAEAALRLLHARAAEHDAKAAS